MLDIKSDVIRTQGDLDRYLQKARNPRATIQSGGKSVDVGIFDTARYANGTPVAAVAAWNEFGVRMPSVAVIPPRPFFREGIRDAKEGVKDICAQGHTQPERKVLEIIGIHVSGKIQRSITEGNWKPNSKFTIERKGSSKPLEDSGLLRNSISYGIIE